MSMEITMAWSSIFVAIARSLTRRIPLHPFFALSLDGLYITTLDGHFQQVNPAFIATLGYPEAALLSRNVLDLLHPHDLPAASRALAGLARGDSPAEIESRFRCADGSCKWLAWTATPFPAQGLAYCVARD